MSGNQKTETEIRNIVTENNFTLTDGELNRLIGYLAYAVREKDYELVKDISDVLYYLHVDITSTNMDREQSEIVKEFKNLIK